MSHYIIRALLLATVAVFIPSCTRSQSPGERLDEARKDDAAPEPGNVARRSKPPRIIQLAAGTTHTCVLTELGTVRCWGNGRDGRLGYGNTKSIGDDEPASAAGDVDLGGKATQITAGYEHTCALMENGAVRCWGHGGFGRLGYGNTKNIGDDETPASAGDVPVGAKVVHIDAGGRHTCVVVESGAVRCWGIGEENQHGYGRGDDVGDDETPASKGDIPLDVPAEKVALEHGTSCALLKTKAVRCWGPKWADEEARELEPRRVPDVELGGKAKQLSAGGRHSCALMDNGGVRCWGDGDDGRSGYPEVSLILERGEESPRAMGDVKLGGRALQVSAGGEHSCAVLEGGMLRCWGSGRFGLLGYGNTKSVGEFDVPAVAGDVNVGARVVAVEAGDFHTCAIIETGAVRCWGRSDEGQLGYGTKVGPEAVPAKLGDVPVF